MRSNGTNIMSCVVVGNSPSVSCDSDVIDSHNYVIRNKIPYGDHNVGERIDMLVSRTRKVNLILNDPTLKEFRYKQIYMDPDDEPHPGELLIYHNNLLKLDLETMKMEIGLKHNEKPTIGIVAVFIGLQLFGSVSMTGIEHEFDSDYINTGHYDDLDYNRVNDHHNLYKEMMYLKKHIRSEHIAVL